LVTIAEIDLRGAHLFFREVLFHRLDVGKALKREVVVGANRFGL
jgi:hypothetical protein